MDTSGVHVDLNHVFAGGVKRDSGWSKVGIASAQSNDGVSKQSYHSYVKVKVPTQPEKDERDPIEIYLQDEDAARDAGGIAHTRWKMANFMEINVIKAIVMAVVCLNGILIGVQLDYGGDETAWESIDAAFLLIFTVEAVVRLIGFGWLFFTDSWNLLDFSVVVVGLVDWIISASTGGDSNPVFTAFRLLRIFRVFKVMRFFDRLSKLVEAFFGAMQDVIWVAILVLIMLYIFGVMVTAFYADHKELDDAGVDSNDLFGTVPRSMATLFQIMTMDGWMSGITRPTANVYGSAWIVFILWAVIGALGLLNLLTAIFIESLTELSRKADRKQQKQMEQQRARVLDIVQKLFFEFDEDHSGTLDVREANLVLNEISNAPEILPAFAVLGITSYHINEAIHLADQDGDGIDYQEFIDCLQIMDAPAQKKDTMMITKQFHRQTDLVCQQISLLTNEVKELRQEVQTLRNPNKAAAPLKSNDLRKMFDEVDSNDSGEIDHKELVMIFEKLVGDSASIEGNQDEVSASELTASMIKDYGTDGVLKFEQFMQMIKENNFQSVFQSLEL